MSESATTPRQGPSGLARFAGIVLALVGGLAWLLPVFTFVFIVPKFAQVFNEMEVSLPVLARFLIGASGMVANYWFVFATALAAVTVGLVIASVVARTRWPVSLSVAFAIVSLVLVIAVQALLVMGLFIPLVHVVEMTA
ncbi:MAG TPA: hypothetical protein VM238_21090 [Phycisphaerae bacterium]|nr:hypothetical protein [Phycisphaerae bacterium]